MSAVDNSGNQNAPTAKGSAVGSEKYVFAFVVFVLVAHGVYQAFFCPTCYATADRTAIQDTREP